MCLGTVLIINSAGTAIPYKQFDGCEIIPKKIWDYLSRHYLASNLFTVCHSEVLYSNLLSLVRNPYIPEYDRFTLAQTIDYCTAPIETLQTLILYLEQFFSIHVKGFNVQIKTLITILKELENKQILGVCFEYGQRDLWRVETVDDRHNFHTRAYNVFLDNKHWSILNPTNHENSNIFPNCNPLQQRYTLTQKPMHVQHQQVSRRALNLHTVVKRD